MLLLINDGRTYQEISDWLGCSYKNVAYWLVHEAPNNLESLSDGRKQGDHRKATDEYVRLLMKVILKTP